MIKRNFQMMNRNVIIILIATFICSLWMLVNISERSLMIHIEGYHTSENSHFLKEFKNPCYLSSNEEKVLGPFWSGRSYDHFLTASKAVIVDAENSRKEVLRCLPYYFVLGWAKSGTTELATKMRQHPDIVSAPLKEPAFISSRRFETNPSKDGFQLKYADDYVDYLGDPTHQMALYYSRYGGPVPLVVGDHSTHTIDQWHSKNKQYTRGIPDAMDDALLTYSNPQMIKYLIPKSKFIVMLRDPVERFYSLYKMHAAISPDDFHTGVVQGITEWNKCIQSDTDLDDCLHTAGAKNAADAHLHGWSKKAFSSIPKSLYYYHIQEWLEVFHRDQFLFIKFEDFISDPDDYINEKVFPFLELPELSGPRRLQMSFAGKEHVVRGRPKGDGTMVDRSYDLPMLDSTRQMLMEFFKPYNEKLSTLLDDPEFDWQYS